MIFLRNRSVKRFIGIFVGQGKAHYPEPETIQIQSGELNQAAL